MLVNMYILRSTTSLGLSVQHDERVTLSISIYLTPWCTQILQKLHNNFHNLPLLYLLTAKTWWRCWSIFCSRVQHPGMWPWNTPKTFVMSRYTILVQVDIPLFIFKVESRSQAPPVICIYAWMIVVCTCWRRYGNIYPCAMLLFSKKHLCILIYLFLANIKKHHEVVKWSEDNLLSCQVEKEALWWSN